MDYKPPPFLGYSSLKKGGEDLQGGYMSLI